MAGVPRLVGAVIGTGLTFPVGVGATVDLVSRVVTLFAGGSFAGVLRAAGRFSVVAFILGVVFAMKV